MSTLNSTRLTSSVTSSTARPCSVRPVLSASFLFEPVALTSKHADVNMATDMLKQAIVRQPKAGQPVLCCDVSILGSYIRDGGPRRSSNITPHSARCSARERRTAWIWPSRSPCTLHAARAGLYERHSRLRGLRTEPSRSVRSSCLQARPSTQ